MNAIKQYRKASGLTQLQTARKIGISLDSIKRYEAGTSEPRATELLKMSELFGCTVDELLGKNPTQPLPAQRPEQGDESSEA